MKYGLQTIEKKKEDYQFGSAVSLKRNKIILGGQWDSFLPHPELQRVGVETMACATFSLLNVVEILEREEFGDKTNWSDRFLAYISGTTKRGNNPFKVAETLRKNGDVFEREWGNNITLDTWNKYYEIPPQKLYTVARQFLKEYNFGHEWVNSTQVDMMLALKFSPLTVAGWAWTQDKNGLFYTPKGKKAVHSFVVYGYVINKYWKVFDSYDNTIKRLRWDYEFSMVQSYTLHSIREGIMDLLIKLLKLLSTLFLSLKQNKHGKN